MGTILVRHFSSFGTWWIRSCSESQSAPLGGQLHVPYIKVYFCIGLLALMLCLMRIAQMRDIYEIRERSSRMYHWSALTTAQVVMELPWNNALLPVLVLDRWLWKFPRRIHISYVRRLLSDLLHDHCISCCFNESHCWDCGPNVLSTVFICPYLVSVSAVHHRYS